MRQLLSSSQSFLLYFPKTVNRFSVSRSYARSLSKHLSCSVLVVAAGCCILAGVVRLPAHAE